jgi:aminoglycoside 6'-N-acetyltransferase I
MGVGHGQVLDSTRLRLAVSSDRDIVARMFAALWPEGELEEHCAEADAVLSGLQLAAKPLAVFVAEADGHVVAFIEVGLRSHADGGDSERPVGFVEGWYVDPEYRRRGIGRALLRAAEDWARSKGCRELTSDTWLNNEPSQRAHEALGFEVVDRCVHYRKVLA